MSKLSIKTVERLKKPYGKFSFELLIRRKGSRSAWGSESNASQVEQMRGLLRDTCGGRFKLVWKANYMGKRVYTKLLMMNAMDVAMLKLVHSDKLFKIYKIKVVETSESPLTANHIVA